MSANAVEISKVSKRFKLYRQRQTTLRERFTRRETTRWEDFWALRDISFDIPRGTSFGLVGPNGSGKSTLLKLIAQVHRPTSGSVVTRGRMSALLELGAGFHPDLTGRENLYLNGAILGLSKRQINAQLDDIVDFSGLGAFIDSPVKVYSSGMAVRLGFSIAIKVDPEILLVDEVIAVGDEEFQRKCVDHMFHLRNSGTTIVLVSHSLGDLRNFCDRGIWIEHGQQRAIGPIDDVIDQYLTAVDSREAAQAAEQAPDGEPGAPDAITRRGSGEIRFTGLELLDADGIVIPAGITNQPLTVRLHFRASAEIPAAEFTFSLAHGSGLEVAAPSSRQATAAFAIVPGDGYVDCSFEEFALNPGSYLVSGAITHRGHLYDVVTRAVELHVRAGKGQPEGGVVRLPGRWSLHQPS